MSLDIEEQLMQVRHLIADLDASPLLTDEQLAVYLDLNGSNVRRAAADALEAIAVSETLVSKKIRTQDLATDGPAVSAELRALAARLRARADEVEAIAGEFEIFDIVDTLPRRRSPELTERNPGRYTVWGL